MSMSSENLDLLRILQIKIQADAVNTEIAGMKAAGEYSEKSFYEKADELRRLTESLHQLIW